MDGKTAVKLQELVFKGHTTVKVKGKYVRLRTPTCSALKKLSEEVSHPGAGKKQARRGQGQGCATTAQKSVIRNHSVDQA